MQQEQISSDLGRFARLEPAEVLTALGSGPGGLSEDDADKRLGIHGPNLIAREGKRSFLKQIAVQLWTPLNIMLLALAGASFALGDAHAAIVIAVMVTLGGGLSFLQEYRSNKAAEALRALVRTNATVVRHPLGLVPEPDNRPAAIDVPVERLVPGDLVLLSAGDMVPADLRLVSTKDLYLNEAALTGEALPVAKSASAATQTAASPLDLPDMCFMGTNVLSGVATGVVVFTGRETSFGQVAEKIVKKRLPTSFERGIDRFVWLMVRFMLAMAVTVLAINGLTKGDWFEALLFAVAVAVGLAPEMMPMIVTVNLAKGALAMSRKRAIVKRLNSIQNFGAMDILCTDKTGTLTQDRVILKEHLDLRGNDSGRVLEFAYLNSYFQSGLKNLLDVAVLKHIELHREMNVESEFEKIDEIPFDFERRRMSVVLKKMDGDHLLICKGAVEEMFSVCSAYEIGHEVGVLDAAQFRSAREETTRLNADGFRVIAVAYREVKTPPPAYSPVDERDLTLLGYIAFLDPPKDSAAAAIRALNRHGVRVKILTGDNDVVARKVCAEVGLLTQKVLLGSEIDAMPADALAAAVESVDLFAKLSPAQKATIIDALHKNDHVVGFLGDGINDGPALKTADVGISVDTAVDIAKESADIILLEKSLTVLDAGVVEGRRVFGNIIKYIRMSASSNFGNVFSIIGASIFLPFLPMAPIQVLALNLLYDFSQTAVPTDSVDDEYLQAPRRWEIGNVMRFMVMVGPVSSIFDYATFFTMLFLFGAWSDSSLFQTGWFVESLLTETLIVHVIRTARIPFLQSRASAALIATTVTIAGIGILLPFTELGIILGFKPLPHLYWPFLALFLSSYAVLAHLAKTYFFRRFGIS
ncbi:MAG TPA: magnesium-translocating P-type ATPase [Gammaproteobacteria bacterium]|nr:magnesium-translocating P-type ATPase [Gammaproteobacteria bacterium]